MTTTVEHRARRVADVPAEVRSRRSMLALAAVESGRLLRHPAVLAATALSVWLLWRWGRGTVPVLHYADIATQFPLAPLAAAALLATNLAVLRPHRDGAVDLYGATRLSLARRTLAHLLSVLPLAALGGCPGRRRPGLAGGCAWQRRRPPHRGGRHRPGPDRARWLAGRAARSRLAVGGGRPAGPGRARPRVADPGRPVHRRARPAVVGVARHAAAAGDHRPATGRAARPSRHLAPGLPAGRRGRPGRAGGVAEPGAGAGAAPRPGRHRRGRGGGAGGHQRRGGGPDQADVGGAGDTAAGRGQRPGAAGLPAARPGGLLRVPRLRAADRPVGADRTGGAGRRAARRGGASGASHRGAARRLAPAVRGRGRGRLRFRPEPYWRPPGRPGRHHLGTGQPDARRHAGASRQQRRRPRDRPARPRAASRTASSQSRAPMRRWGHPLPRGAAGPGRWWRCGCPRG